mgnify:CR=1 FL=1
MFEGTEHNENVGRDSRAFLPAGRGQLEGVYDDDPQGQPQFRLIRTGETSGEDTEVLSGVSAGDSVFEGGERIVATQLGYEIARYVFGPAAERCRRVAEDGQVQQALSLLRGTTSPQALLGMAPAAAPAH